MSFLPDGNEPPQYLEFEAGENRFRILSEIVKGIQYSIDSSWNFFSNPGAKGSQVVYAPRLSELPREVLDNPNFGFKHVQIFAVFNRNTERIQICLLNKSTVWRVMEDYLNSREWSDQTRYDFVVTRQGESLATTYRVRVGLPEPLDEAVIALYREMALDLTAYFRGENPFGRDDQVQEEVQQPQPNASDVVYPPFQTQVNGPAVAPYPLGG